MNCKQFQFLIESKADAVLISFLVVFLLGHFTRFIGGSSFRNYLDLFKFRFFKAKKSCHIGDLIRTHEVRGLRAEFLYTGSKLAALHCFRDVQANAAGALLRAKQAEIANDHFTSLLMLICSLTTSHPSRDHASLPGPKIIG